MSVTTTSVKVSMLGLLGASAPVGAVAPDLWLNWGLAGVVVGFTLWRDYHRERRLTAAIERHDAWTRDTLLSALSQNTAALQEVTRALREHRS